MTQALTETQKKTRTQRHTDEQTRKAVDWRLGAKRLTWDTGTDWLRRTAKRAQQSHNQDETTWEPANDKDTALDRASDKS